MFVRLISIALIVVGAAGFVAPFWIGAAFDDIGAVELPLVEINDVAVSDDGRVFFALNHLGRIQAHAPDGKFLRNFRVDNAGGSFCIDVAGDQLTASVARRDALDEFDLNGAPIRLNTPISDEQYDIACRRDPGIRFLDESFEAVTVAFADGRAPLKLQRKWWHYFAYGPIGSWLVLVAGLLLWPEWRHAILKRIRGEK